jgi:aminoglycoside 3-N-acetyltransferase
MDRGDPVTRTDLEHDLRRLGVAPGSIVMVHAGLRSLGWVVGGAETVVTALLAAAGPRGTVCAQVSWEDVPFGIEQWPPAWQRRYRAAFPPFDRARSGAAAYEGRLAERIRTWPGARRSANPIAGVAAIGARARWLTRRHALDDGFGPGTPYARLTAAGGQVLLLGAPLRSISLLHHAEALARVPKARTTLTLPVRHRRRVRTRALHELDVWRGPVAYGAVLDGEPYPLGVIAASALGAGIGHRGRVAAATAHLFPAAELVAFATDWLEARFSDRVPPSG